LVRTETLQRWKIEQDVDNHNEKPCYNVKLLSMSLIDRILEQTDETDLTGPHNVSEKSSSCQDFDEICRSIRNRFLDILGDVYMR
jgi:hypothetical protein